MKKRKAMIEKRLFKNRMRAKKRKVMREKRLLKLLDAIVYSGSDKTQLFRQNHEILAKLVQLEIERNRRN